MIRSSTAHFARQKVPLRTGVKYKSSHIPAPKQVERYSSTYFGSLNFRKVTAHERKKSQEAESLKEPNPAVNEFWLDPAALMCPGLAPLSEAIKAVCVKPSGPSSSYCWMQ